MASGSLTHPPVSNYGAQKNAYLQLSLWPQEGPGEDWGPSTPPVSLPPGLRAVETKRANPDAALARQLARNLQPLLFEIHPARPRPAGLHLPLFHPLLCLHSSSRRAGRRALCSPGLRRLGPANRPAPPAWHARHGRWPTCPRPAVSPLPSISRRRWLRGEGRDGRLTGRTGQGSVSSPKWARGRGEATV